MATCVFCGASGKLTGEHVLGDWLARTPLKQDAVPHEAGWLNRVGRDLGSSPPFRRKVNDVCEVCNSGWMSRLEQVASRALTPFILGRPGRLETADQPFVARWAQKTVLVAMLLSSEVDREVGYGLPPADYRELYELRDAAWPLPASRVWVGRYVGERDWSVRATPVVVVPKGLPDPEGPQGYVMTLTIGQLVVHGIRFTVPALEVPMTTQQGLAQIWPVVDRAEWPTGASVTDEIFHPFARGEMLLSDEQAISVHHWKIATELPRSQLGGSSVELPTACGKHVVYYPAALAIRGRHGQGYAFVTMCECEIGYLIFTEPDGAHCKDAGSPEKILEAYEALPGEEYELLDRAGVFRCKRIEPRR